MKDKLDSLIQYRSKEMIAATKLIRNSKAVFDSISNKDIEKAVILRDGKPSYLLIDLEEYESIIETCKMIVINIKKESKEKKKENKILKEEQAKVRIPKKKAAVESTTNVEIGSSDDKTDLLAKLDSIDGVIKNETSTQNNPLKDFWD